MIKFYNVIYNFIDDCSLKVHTFCTNNTKYPIWFNKQLISKIKEKERCRKKLRKQKHQLTSNNEKYVSLRYEVKKSIKECHAKYIVDISNSIQDNSSAFWNYIKSKRKNTTPAASFSYEGGTIVNDIDIANAFAKYFGSVYEKDPNEKDSKECHEIINLNEFPLENLKIELVTEQDIATAIKMLKPKSAIGIDGIPAFFYKGYCDILVKPICMLMNLALKSNCFPNQLKICSITPLHKSGKTNEISNYRPVAIPTALAKIFERVIHNKIYNHVKGVIIREQHGFVKNRSTNTNLSIISHDIAHEIHSGGQIDVVYTDLAKAFDKVNHSTLIKKLKIYNFDDNLLKFLKSYLNNRIQFVTYKDTKSNQFIPTSGVPQGSILGPLLFVLFINDVFKYVKYSKFLLYADDLKLYKTIHNNCDSNQLQYDINSISEYCHINQLKLNKSKCYYIHFSRKIIPIITKYKIENLNIERKKEVKDLGIIFNQYFSFGSHITQLVNECQRKLGLIIRFCYEFKYEICINLFNSLIRSKLEYACTIWNPKTIYHSNEIEKIQKKFLRYTYFKAYGTYPRYPILISYNTQLDLFNIDSLEKRRELCQIKFVRDIFAGTFGDLLTSLVYINVPDIRLRTRNVTFAVNCSLSPLCRSLSTCNKIICEKPSIDIFNTTNEELVKMYKTN